MKQRRGSEAMWPDAGVLVPFAVLFVTSFNGPTVQDAWRTALNLFFSWGPGLLMWAEVVLLNVLGYLYFYPIIKVHIVCMNACEPSQKLVDKAMHHLNRVKAWTVISSVLVFMVGRAVMALLDGAISSQGLAGELPPLLAEAAIGGFLVGVIFALQYESRLYEARQTIMKLGTRVKPAYSSLFSKVMIILVAIVLFMTLQAFSLAGGFFSSLGQGPIPGPPPPGAFYSGPDLIYHARKFAGVSDNLNVFLVKFVIISIFFGQMLWQLKRIISRPLATIMDRLSVLNSPLQSGVKTIDIVQNDEFAPAYRQINDLITRQQGQLEVSRRRLEELIELAADPIVAFDSERKVKIFNSAAAEIFQCPRGEALGGPIDVFLENPVDVVGDEARPLRWINSRREPLLLESHVSRREGDYWTTVILHDIRKQAEIEDNLREARVEAENASRMKSEFLANMSHELRTPLNAILGFTQLLGNDRNLTESQIEKIRIITNSGEHLLSLINDILDISKIEAGKMELHLVVFDLHEFIRDLEDMFTMRCRKKGLSLYVETLEGLPRFVRGDLGKLRQVMINLIGNAVKFTDEGGVGFLAGGEGGAIRFVVRDTGRGIPSDELGLIMRPFVQASTTDHEGGTGLGLAISSRFIAMMGGTLEAQSSLGEGSVFSFTLPLEVSSEAPRVDSDANLEIMVDPETQVRVLVVDDQESNRLVLREMLERVGFLVDEARDGKEAYASALASSPAIAFMDIKMPVMDGYEAVAQFKQDGRTSGIRVFALTASAFSHDEERIAAAGFDGFLAKPFKQSSLYRLILDRGRVPLVSMRAAVDEELVAPSLPESGELALIGVETRRRIEDAVLINDFASLGALAEEIAARTPALAAALRAAASSYDERAVADILIAMKTEGAAHG